MTERTHSLEGYVTHLSKWRPDTIAIYIGNVLEVPVEGTKITITWKGPHVHDLYATGLVGVTELLVRCRVEGCKDQWYVPNKIPKEMMP